MRYPQHGTYLWGAAADDGRPPLWLTAAGTWGSDKRPLAAIDILDWLLDLPSRFGLAVFVVFSFGYDVTQILQASSTPQGVGDRQTLDLPGRRWRKPVDRPRARILGRIRNQLHQGKILRSLATSLIRISPTQQAKTVRGISTHRRTSAIYDVFGFFQSSFSAVVQSMVESGRASTDEADFIATMKDRRDQFANEDIDQIKAYTTLELRLLARMMGTYARGFDRSELRLRHWHGAGAAASALIESQKLKMHYGPDIAASNISPQQNAAHHAYFGGRIELLKQGYVENVQLHVYDIASAYPAAMVEFPSLAGGEWINQSRLRIPIEFAW